MTFAQIRGLTNLPGRSEYRTKLTVKTETQVWYLQKPVGLTVYFDRIMKTNYIHRFAKASSFVVCVALIIVCCDCTVGSSRNINIGTVPGQTPANTTPLNVRNSSFDRSKESYRVYSVILNHKWEKGNVAVRDRTDRGLFQNDEWLDKNAGKSDPEAVNDFKNANDNDVQLESRFDYTGKIYLIDQQEFKKTIGGGNGWDAFRSSHPGASGIITFSAVGFDRDGSRAVVNVSYLCASHCGNGSFYILEKNNGEWLISQEIGTWMS
jgi:hypothetical protein